MYFTDPTAGPIFIALHPTAADHVAVHLSAMLGQLDNLRAEWRQRNGGTA